MEALPTDLLRRLALLLGGVSLVSLVRVSKTLHRVVSDLSLTSSTLLSALTADDFERVEYHSSDISTACQASVEAAGNCSEKVVMYFYKRVKDSLQLQVLTLALLSTARRGDMGQLHRYLRLLKRRGDAVEGVYDYSDIAFEAAKGGQMEIVDYLRSTYSLDDWPLVGLAEGGHLELLRVVPVEGHQREIDWFWNNVGYSSARHGHLSCVILAVSRTSRKNLDSVAAEALAGGHLEVVEYCESLGFSWQHAVSHFVYHYPDLPQNSLEYCESKPVNWQGVIAETAVSYPQLSEYLVKRRSS